jgi:hypothetical protein
MVATNLKFNTIVESIYSLPIEDREEIRSLLDRNIADTRRDEIAHNFELAKAEEKSGNMKFSSSIEELKNML